MTTDKKSEKLAKKIQQGHEKAHKRYKERGYQARQTCAPLTHYQEKKRGGLFD